MFYIKIALLIITFPLGVGLIVWLYNRKDKLDHRSVESIIDKKRDVIK